MVKLKSFLQPNVKNNISKLVHKTNNLYKLNFLKLKSDLHPRTLFKNNKQLTSISNMWKQF